METNVDAAHGPTGDAWAVASFAMTVLTSAVFLFAPVGMRSESGGGQPAVWASGSTASLAPPKVLLPRTPVRVTSESIFGTDGWRVVPAFAVPVVAAAAVVMLRRTRLRRAATVAGMILLFAFVVVASLSIGIFYAPAAVLMAIAASRTPRRETETVA
jgi:hypothetical protein